MARKAKPQPLRLPNHTRFLEKALSALALIYEDEKYKLEDRLKASAITLRYFSEAVMDVEVIEETEKQHRRHNG